MHGTKLKILVASILLTACGKEGDKVNYLLAAPTTIAEKDSLGLVVCEGGSMSTDAFAGVSYCDLLAKAGWATKNVALNEQTSTAILADATEEVDPLVCKEGDSLAVYWEGLGSFVLEDQTPEAAYGAFKEYSEGRKAAGFKTMILTMVTTQNSALSARLVENWRQRYNALVLANEAEADLVLDLNQDPRMMDSASVTYFTADQIHHNRAGVHAVFESVQKTIIGAGFEPAAIAEKE